MNLLILDSLILWNQDGENSIYHRVQWFRVVLDEAHHIKAHKSQVAQATIALSSHCRWCLTGTPLQVNYWETFCVIYRIASRKVLLPYNELIVIKQKSVLSRISFWNCDVLCFRIVWRIYSVSCLSCALNLGAAGSGMSNIRLSCS